MPKRISKNVISILLFVLTSNNISAQLEAEKFYYGFTAGISYSKIGDVQTTLIRPVFPTETYSTTTNPLLGFTGGATIYYRFEKSKFAIQPEITYSAQGGNFHYEDIEELTYDINFNYGHLNITPMVKFYPVHGLYASVGPQLGIVIDRSALTYTSNQPELGPDLQIQQSLREVLKGNNSVAVVLGAGYDMPFGLSVNARWVYGLSDAIETLANGFYFIENKNPPSNFQLTLGYHIPFFKNRNY